MEKREIRKVEKQNYEESEGGIYGIDMIFFLNNE